MSTRWWFKYGVPFFHPETWGRFPFWRSILQHGLKPSNCWWNGISCTYMRKPGKVYQPIRARLVNIPGAVSRISSIKFGCHWSNGLGWKTIFPGGTHPFMVRTGLEKFRNSVFFVFLEKHIMKLLLGSKIRSICATTQHPVVTHCCVRMGLAPRHNVSGVIAMQASQLRSPKYGPSRATASTFPNGLFVGLEMGCSIHLSTCTLLYWDDLPRWRNLLGWPLLGSDLVTIDRFVSWLITNLFPIWREVTLQPDNYGQLKFKLKVVLGYIGRFILTQLYRRYNKPSRRIPIDTTSIVETVGWFLFDGRNPAPDLDRSSHRFTTGFLHPRWLFEDFFHQQYLTL